MSSSCDCSSQGVEADEGEVLLVGQAVHEVGGVPGLLHLHRYVYRYILRTVQ